MNYIADLIAAAGITLITVGLWWVYPPASMIFLGGAIVLIAVRGGAARGGRKPADPEI